MTTSWAHNLKLMRSLYDTNYDQLQTNCETLIVRNVISKCKPNNMLLFRLPFFPHHFTVFLELKKQSSVSLLNPFSTNVPLLYPLKTSENFWKVLRKAPLVGFTLLRALKLQLY